MPAKPRDFEPLPYYRWYWRDFRSSRTVQRMHYVARGLYRELLDECWSKGCIPDDVAQLAEICGCPVNIMSTHWNTLQRMFKSVDSGLLVNERIENERTESDKTRATKAVAGRKSAESRQRLLTAVNGNEHNATEANTLLSSSSSSSSSRAEQSSSACSPDENPSSAPVAALGPEGPRAPVAKQPPAGNLGEWREILEKNGARKRQPQ